MRALYFVLYPAVHALVVCTRGPAGMLSVCEELVVRMVEWDATLTNPKP